MTVLAVTFENLLTVAVAAGVAGIGVTAIFSLAVLGAARSAEARHAGRSATGWSALTVLAACGVLAASVAGLYVVAGG
jgi:hypothetical protein